MKLAPGFVKTTDAEGNKILSCGEKKIYCVGANNKIAYQRIRGMSIGGWYADEINLHNKLFIEEAIRRTIQSQQRRIFWTLNPDVPNHFIYQNYIDYYGSNSELAEEVGGYKYWHFVLADNSAISEEQRRQIIADYEGKEFEYRRYILGQRVLAEGNIYNFKSSMIIKELPKDIILAEIAVS